jgi:glycerophosphoryl diester phosphodiesterase
VRIVAHRTCPLDAPENSLAGIEAASAAGADLAEIDVRLTRDLVPVLCHDSLPWRTLRWPVPVRLTPSPRFTRLRARDRAPHDRPPTLASAAAALPAALGFAVDCKASTALGPTIEVLGAAGVLDRSELWVRTRRAAGLALARGAGCRVALLGPALSPSLALRYLDRAARAGVHAASLDDALITPDVVARAHGLGLFLYCWVRDEGAHRRVVDAGVDGIVTDWPRTARAAATG